MDYIDTIKDDFGEIELRTPFESVLEQKIISDRFRIEPPLYLASPVYYIRSSDMLVNIASNENVAVTPMNDNDYPEIAHDVEQGRLDAIMGMQFRQSMHKLPKSADLCVMLSLCAGHSSQDDGCGNGLNIISTLKAYRSKHEPALLIKRIDVGFSLLHYIFLCQLQYIHNASSSDMLILIFFANNNSLFGIVS